MTYRVKFSKNALKTLKKMDVTTQKIIIGWIEKNLEGCEDPYAKGKALTGDKKGQWRYRVGDYRILTEIHNDEIIIYILEIGHRREIYK